MHLILEQENEYGILFNIGGYLFNNFTYKDEEIGNDDFVIPMIPVIEMNTKKIQYLNGDNVKNIYLTELQKSIFKLCDDLIKDKNKKDSP